MFTSLSKFSVKEHLQQLHGDRVDLIVTADVEVVGVGGVRGTMAWNHPTIFTSPKTMKL